MIVQNDSFNLVTWISNKLSHQIEDAKHLENIIYLLNLTYFDKHGVYLLCKNNDLNMSVSIDLEKELHQLFVLAKLFDSPEQIQGMFINETISVLINRV